jgi:hypothetical protein
MILMKCVQHDDVREEALKQHHPTLEAALHALQKAVAHRSYNKGSKQTPRPQTPRPTNFRPHPYAPPPRLQFKQTQIPGTPQVLSSSSASMQVTPVVRHQPPMPPPVNHTPAMPPSMNQSPAMPLLSKLSPEERERCVQHILPFRCREAGHSASNCPLRSTDPKLQ